MEGFGLVEIEEGVVTTRQHGGYVVDETLEVGVADRVDGPRVAWLM